MRRVTGISLYNCIAWVCTVYLVAGVVFVAAHFLLGPLATKMMTYSTRANKKQKNTGRFSAPSMAPRRMQIS
jgi:hypothetical protein